MKLSFRDLKQNKFIIEAEPSDLISQVKQRIADEKGWDASTQKLIYSGKILQDANTVESYKIEEKGFIVCMTTKPKITPATPTSTTTPAPTSASGQVTGANPSPRPPISSNVGDAASTVPTTSSSTSASSSITSNTAGLTPSGISMGAEREAQIAELEIMGFERSQIEAAMRAAFYNSERAVEYLLNGIPENLLSNTLQSATTSSSTTSATPAPAQSAEQEGISRNLFDVAAALSTGTTGGGAGRGSSTNTTTGGNLAGLGNLDFLRNNPQFQQLRQVVQQQPHMLEPILQQVGAGNPQLAALIGDHSQQFLRLLSEGADNDSVLPPGAHAITVTEDERAAIERLCHLGFSRDLATQAYFACDKNEELAANFLFEQPDDEQ
ncbi:UV excision repair protein rhp23 [Erysiphe necator]|nr:UV excision repair protein rhp23 [Erysiphe necator]